MAKTPLNKNSDFIVREDKMLLYVLAILFFGLFLYGMIDAVIHQFKKVDYSFLIFILALVFALFCLQKAKRNRIYLRVNKKGIYRDERLLTTWPNLINVFLSQKQKVVSIQDNFILVVEFKKQNDPTKGLRRHIPLTNTQNKSEEEVLEAVNFFWNLYKRETRTR